MATKSKSRIEEIEDVMKHVVGTLGAGETVQELTVRLADMRKQGLSRPHFNLESPYSNSVHWCESQSKDLE